MLVTGRLIGEAKAVAKTLARTAPADFQPTLISDFFTYSRKNHTQISHQIVRVKWWAGSSGRPAGRLSLMRVSDDTPGPGTSHL